MDWSVITEVGHHIATGAPSVLTALLLLAVARSLFLLTTALKADQDLLDSENPAVGIVFAAYLLGTGIALAGTMFGRHQESVAVHAGKVAVEGLLAIVLLRLSIWVNDKLILHRFCITKELREDRNLGVGFSVAGSCLACGLVLNGALTGFSTSFLNGLWDVFVYWLIGQVALVAGAFVYERIKKYDVHQLIEYDDNIAVGIGFGAFLVSLGLVVRASIAGAGFDSMSKELPRALLLASFGIIGVMAVHVSATLLVARHVHYEQDVEMRGNVAVSTVAACASLAGAILLASVIQR